MARQSCKNSGFTLVEVLVALVVVAVGMSALLAALGAAADNTSYLRDKTFAQWVALNRVAELRLQGRMPSKGKQSGETEFAGNKWQWEQEVKDLDVPGVVRIDVNVRLAGGSAAEKKRWMGSALGVMGDAIGPPLNPLEVVQTWELEVTPPGGQNPNGEPNNPGNPSNDGNSDVEPPPQPPRTEEGAE